MRQLVVSALGVALVIITTGCSLVPSGEVSKGVYLNNQDLSGYSRDGVTDVVKSLAAEKRNITLLDAEGKEKVVSATEIGVTVDIEETVNQIMRYGYEDDAMTLVKNRVSALVTPVTFKPIYTVDEPQATMYLSKFSKTFALDGTNAYLSVEGNSVVLHGEKVGKELDMDATMKNLRQLIGDENWSPLKPVINSNVQPKVTSKQLEGLTEILAVYMTEYNPDAQSRSHNIELATNKVNGQLIPSGATFSFNQTVGERTANAGYDDAPVIVNGKLEPGIGGGICQVSSTLFNVALLSGMEIVERTSHYSPVGYIGVGRDATVAYGYIDFQFRNAFSHPVYVVAYASGGTMTVYIIGSKADKLKAVSIQVSAPVVTPHKTVEVKDNTLSEDKIEEGHDGIAVVTTRSLVYQNGSAHKDSLESVYEPVDTVITKGTKPPTNDKNKKK